MENIKELNKRGKTNKYLNFEYKRLLPFGKK